MIGFLRKTFASIISVALTAAAFAQPAPDPALSRYAKPAQLVELSGGRTLNLDCRGAGSPTVLLFPGLTGWSQSWSPVHDKLAESHRVCTFDPAGFGFSGASSKPQNAHNIVADVDAGLAKAKIKGPFVAAGHSMGGLLALRFTDLHRKDVVGLVLVDPSYPDQVARGMKVAPLMVDFFINVMTKQQVADQQACADLAAKGPLSPDDPKVQACMFFEPTFPEDMRAALIRAASDPKVMLTRKSHLAEMTTTSRQLAKPKRGYGDLPLIVLTRGNLGPPPGPPPPGVTPEAEAQGPALDADWVKAHEELSRLSSRGQHRTVANAGHMIQFDDPGAVVAAISDVLAIGAGLR